MALFPASLLRVLGSQKRESKYLIAHSLKSATLPSEALTKQPMEDQAPNKNLAAPPILSQYLSAHTDTLWGLRQAKQKLLVPSYRPGGLAPWPNLPTCSSF